MNLIEQLGDYEKAKTKCDALHDLDVFEINGEIYAKSYLDDALLEYRRENNIFEVGDLVVYESEMGLNGLFQTETLTKKGKPKTVKAGRFGNFPCCYCDVRHATNYEIKTGKRCNHPLNNKHADGTCGLCGLRVHDEVKL